MPVTASVDLSRVAQALGLPEVRVRTVVELLDGGNTVPFITRYRKDQTGGLDEEQIRDVQARVVKLRLLQERKQTILRSIESQGKLTPELSATIEAADTTRRLEDLYLPFKPKKQTLATLARTRGLEPLALEILAADPAAANLDARAADFVTSDAQIVPPEQRVANAADALLGAGHILAEMFGERADIRGKLRAILERTGKLVSTGTEPETKPEERKEPESKKAEPASATEATEPFSAAAEASAEPVVEMPVAEETAAPTVESAPVVEGAPIDESAPPGEPTATEAVAETTEAAAAEAVSEPAAAPTPAPAAPAKGRGKHGRKDKEQEKKDKEAALLKAFRDYFNYREALPKVPPHRVLAINRGERARALRVRIESDVEAMYRLVDELLVPADHPHAEFLRGCARDALSRLVLPSLEREVRRELTDHAELHAVEVFARNLRNLLLQPPVRDRRVLAIDPGFKSGCKLVALDEFGNLLDHGVIHLIGKPERKEEAKTKLVELLKQHNLGVIAIGNGTACRETEQWISDLIAGELAELKVAYVIVNEAGASVYSTSRLGREEFPNYDATLRGAISIGRRLQDPLSELVKIDPANIGVGMYQHDVKAKHLRDSLDAVVESCVNYVGVDLNTASPALLRYVSGLNQLTAQRLYDHRRANGPFKNREQLKAISGFGESTFVQAAGFLKIVGGDNPLDTTWIHPESYPATAGVLAKLGASPTDLADSAQATALAERTPTLNVELLAGELNLGSLTLGDILAQLQRPGRDPRESLPPPIFKQGVLKLDDLTPSMELAGTVLNVVDFGAFVDIGLKDSGLVHISQLANRYVQDPHQVVSVGDTVKVWVLEIDKQRRRVSLTMIAPGTKRTSEGRRPSRPPVAATAGATDGAAAATNTGGRPPRPAGRPQRPRAPVGGGQGGGGQGGGRKKSYAPPPKPIYKPKPKPKPLVPLTKAMEEGKAPLRTFGDLMQFWAKKHDEPPAQDEQPETK